MCLLYVGLVGGLSFCIGLVLAVHVHLSLINVCEFGARSDQFSSVHLVLKGSWESKYSVEVKVKRFERTQIDIQCTHEKCRDSVIKWMF